MISKMEIDLSFGGEKEMRKNKNIFVFKNMAYVIF